MASDPTYHQDASIVLVGLTGAGKTTLAMIASLALGRKYVNFTTFYEKRTNISPNKHIEQHGFESYRESEFAVAKILFQECQSDHVIEGLCRFGNKGYKAILKDVAITNPIIYVRREKEELRKFVSSDDVKFEQWYRHCDAFYTSCSSFDFYNLHIATNDTRNSSTASTLKLKATEIDFVRFLHRLFGIPVRLLHSVDPLSSTHTYALTFSLDWLEICADFEDLECGADTVNLVVNLARNITDPFDRVARQIAQLRRRSRVPVIFEARFSPENTSAYVALLKLGLRCLPDLITIDLRVDDLQIQSILHAKVSIGKIGIFHFEEPWPSSVDHSPCSDLYKKAKALSCDAIRFSRHAENRSDNSKCATLAHNMTQMYGMPTIAYNIGRMGRTSLCFNSILSPTIPPSMTSDGLTVRQVQSALYSCFVATQKKFVLFGKSVSHSLSPAMHNLAYQAVGMPHHYGTLQSDSFSDISQILSEEECAGIAVTLPFKTNALQMLDHVSKEARDIGAVNTITIDRSEPSNGTKDTILLKGHNTDHVGLRECIHRNLSPANTIRTTTSALIIGAGGMARAALYACHTLGVKHFFIVNRTYRNAQILAQSEPWSSKDIHVLRSMNDEWPSHVQHPTIMISAIPSHEIDGQPPHKLTIPDSWLQNRTGGVFVEVSYEPPVSRFITQFRSLPPDRGWVVVDGLNVLVEQGIAQFEIFTGRPAPVHVMRRAVREGNANTNTREVNG